MPFNSLQKSPGQNLSPNLSLASDTAGQVWQALGEIGRQLQILASLQAGGVSCAQAPAGGIPIATLPPAPAPIHNLGAGFSPVTVGQLLREFLLVKARAGKSDRYLRALRNSLLKFSAGRHGRPVHLVTIHELEDWIHSQGWSGRTQKGYLGDVRTFLNFGIRRGYLVRNVAAGVELRAVLPPASVIQTPAQAAAVLEFARLYDLNLCRELAVRYFTGIRSSEASRLAEANLGREFVEVTAANSKTRRRRLVPITKNLRAWLDLGGALPVVGCHSNVWRCFKAALRKAGHDLPANVCRHCFCSYHLALHQSAARTALAAGHTEQMLFAHYREIATPEASAAFFEIRPKTTR